MKKVIYAEDLLAVLCDDININGSNLAKVRRHINAAPSVDVATIIPDRLADMTAELTDVDIQVVLTLANHNMNVSETSRSLYMHRNTVVYHIEKVKELTGLDPTNFHDLVELVQMARAGRTENG